MATEQISVAGQPVAQLTDHSRPTHGNVLETTKGRRYRVVRRYEAHGGVVRIHLRGADTVSLFPSVYDVHEWVNEKGWELYP